MRTHHAIFRMIGSMVRAKRSLISASAGNRSACVSAKTSPAVSGNMHSRAPGGDQRPCSC